MKHVIIYPTDTAYALGCDARDDDAVRQIFKIKGREDTKTLPLIASNIDMVQEWCDLSGKAEELAQKYWPGPLTLVLPIKKHEILRGRMPPQDDGLSQSVINEGSVAIRVPDSKEAQELSEKLGAPIVSTSANLSGDNNPYSIDDARASLGDNMGLVDKIIDKGKLEKQEPSTIVKINNDEIEVLREGSIKL